MKKVERKEIEFECYNCSGTGMIRGSIDADTGMTVDCPICKGIGKYLESYYYFIDGKKKIAFSGDTLK